MTSDATSEQSLEMLNAKILHTLSEGWNVGPVMIT